MTLVLVSQNSFTDSDLPLFPLESVPGTVLLVEPAPSYVAGVRATGTEFPDRSVWLDGAAVMLEHANMTGNDSRAQNM